MYDKNTCKNCKNFHKNGECRHNPPVIIIDCNIDNTFIHKTVFPEAAKNDWCGKFVSYTKNKQKK